jgi:alkanesulfonate monooxygenase SsuD/methylene tetrahydromethanopterin reductase-like flavin-dependent oxidoreductase (luciferase family)
MKPFSFTAIKGTPAQIVEQLHDRVRKGITFFTVMFGDFGPPQTIDLFAREVMPAFA